MTTRSKNLLILGLIIAPFVLTFVGVRLFVDLEEMDKVNKGHLIVPHVDIVDLKPLHLSGETFSRKALTGQWTLLYVADGDCDAACKNGLFYLITQLRRSLDTDTPRVRRMIAHTREPDAGLRAFLDNEVEGMEEIRLDPLAASEALAPFLNSPSPADHIFIVSPDGMLFLWYPTHEDMQQVLLEAENIRSDLKRTLKGSLVG